MGIRPYLGRSFKQNFLLLLTKKGHTLDDNPVQHPGPYHHLRDPVPERTEWMKPQFLVPESHGLMVPQNGSCRGHCVVLGQWLEFAGGEFHPLATNAFSQQLGPLGPLISPLQQLIRHLQKATWHQKKEATVTAAAARNFISCGKYIYFPEVLNNMVCNDNCRRCFPSHRATPSRHPFLFSDFP